VFRPTRRLPRWILALSWTWLKMRANSSALCTTLRLVQIYTCTEYDYPVAYFWANKALARVLQIFDENGLLIKWMGNEVTSIFCFASYVFCEQVGYFELTAQVTSTLPCPSSLFPGIGHWIPLLTSHFSHNMMLLFFNCAHSCLRNERKLFKNKIGVQLSCSDCHEIESTGKTAKRVPAFWHSATTESVGCWSIPQSNNKAVVHMKLTSRCHKLKLYASILSHMISFFYYRFVESFLTMLIKFFSS